MSIEEHTESMAQRVGRMAPAAAKQLRERLDGTPFKDLPGANEVGPMRALAAYKILRPMLIAKEQEA